MTEEQNIYDDCHFKNRLTEEKKPAFTTEPRDKKFLDWVEKNPLPSWVEHLKKTGVMKSDPDNCSGDIIQF